QNLIFGTLEVNSIPAGAAILINGAETGYNTPHFFRGLVTGKYNITLIRENYPTRTEIVQVKKDEAVSLNPVLDNQPPEFADWTLDPPNLTEDSKGRLRVSVKVFDKGGSGLAGKIPQFDYHIGANTNYTGFKDMNKGTGDFWYFDIPEPLETWDVHRGKYIYFKASVVDVAGNRGESAEQTELIDDINDPPIVKITSKFNVWEKGLIKIDADASDIDGKISRVRFEYSIDNITWTQIGPIDDTPPYSVAWDTVTVIKGIVKNVWIRVTAYDDKDATAIDSTKTTFGIDNQPPTTTNDYDRLWHNKDFVINLKSSDGEGIGVSKIFYTLNKGIKQESQEGQTSLSVNITREGSDNILEYWSLDKLGNEEQQKTLSNIKLDKSPPKFAEWKQDPPDITEDSKGRLRISLQVTDEGGSGLEGKVPQIDYRIGRNARYDGYENMITEDGKTWQFNIFEPLETWDAYRGDFIFYKVRIEDVAGNVAESLERSELIDDINDPPVVTITSTFRPWMKGKFMIEAVSSDIDGKIVGVQFEYSSDKNSWTPIGPIDITPPYAVEWDTSVVIPKAEKIWIRATATDDGNARTSYIYPVMVGID
ncbi:PEGA domain-containing protein, partial [Candidatus Poribacteria bacterium]|nr:PEGA domain-containing protein [Candidatus Poribacteria bacterium]